RPGTPMSSWLSLKAACNPMSHQVEDGDRQGLEAREILPRPYPGCRPDRDIRMRSQPALLCRRQPSLQAGCLAGILGCLLGTFPPALLFAQRRTPERSLTGQGGRLTTDQQIALYQKQAASKPSNPHLQNLLASAYIQKVRESTDFTYLDRASKIIDSVLAADAGNYEAMRLRSEIEMERHHFSQVREYSEELTKIAPDDTWNWGTLGDSLME